MKPAEFRAWALRGAERRLQDIAEEAKAIFRHFPELRARGRGFEAATEGAAGKHAERPARRRRKMSAAGRKRISEAQKARWAKQREKNGARPATAGSRSRTRKGGRKKK